MRCPPYRALGITLFVVWLAFSGVSLAGELDSSTGQPASTQTTSSASAAAAPATAATLAVTSVPIDTTWEEAGISTTGYYFRNLDEYVSPVTGLLTVHQVDLATTGPGPRLSLARVYQTPGLFRNGEPYSPVPKAYANLGDAWSLDLPFIHDSQLYYLRGQQFKITWTTVDSQLRKFENHKNAHFLLTKHLVNGATDHFELTTAGGMLYRFDKDGYLTKIADPNGYSLTFTLESIPAGSLPEDYCRNLLEIKDSMGRAIRLEHANGMLAAATLSGPGGEARTVRYDYQDSNLYSVLDPIGVSTGVAEGHLTLFEYSGSNPWLLTQIDYPTGGSADYDYNQRSEYYSPDTYSKYSVGYQYRDDYYRDFDYTMGTGDSWFNVVATAVTTNTFDFDEVTVMRETYDIVGGTVKSHVILDPSGTEVRRTDYTYNANKERTSQTETLRGSSTAQTITKWWYDKWGNIIEEKDPLGHSHYYSYVNSTATQAGTPDWATWVSTSPDFYASFVTDQVRDRLAGAFYYQDAAKTKRVESYYEYDSTGNQTEAKLLQDDTATWIKTRMSYSHSAADITYGPVSVVRGCGLPPELQVRTTFGYDQFRAFPVRSTVIVEGVIVNRVSLPYYPVVATWTQHPDTGMMASKTDANGNTTEYQYDLLDRPTLIIYPTRNGETERLAAHIQYDDGAPGFPYAPGFHFYHAFSTATLSYGSWSPSTGFTRRGLIKRFGFDGFGRQTSAETFANATDYPSTPTSRRTVSYNWQGLIASETLSSASGGTYVTKYDYDVLGRLVRVTNSDGTYRLTTYDDAANWQGTLDADGSKKTVVDERGHRKEYLYDWGGRLVQVIEYANGVPPITTTYDYDSAGNLVKLTDGRGKVTTYAYDRLNRLVSTTHPDLSSEMVSYDPLGRPGTKTDRSGRVLDFHYNELDLLVKQEAKKSSEPIAREIAKYGYDPAGNQVLAVAGNSTSWRAFDALSRMTAEETTLNGKTFTTAYAYDSLGLLTGVTSPSSRAIGLEYYGDGTLKTVRRGSAADAPVLASYRYWPYGLVQNMTSGNGTTTDFRLDAARLRVDRITTHAPSGGTLLDLVYAFEADGDIKAINNDEFAYDGLGRLVDSVVY